MAAPGDIETDADRTNVNPPMTCTEVAPAYDDASEAAPPLGDLKSGTKTTADCGRRRCWMCRGTLRCADVGELGDVDDSGGVTVETTACADEAPLVTVVAASGGEALDLLPLLLSDGRCG